MTFSLSLHAVWPRSSSVHNLYTAFPLVFSCYSARIAYRSVQEPILYPTFFIYHTLLSCTHLSHTALLSASSMQVNLVLAVDCLFPYVYSYGPLSVCLYMSLSVLVFILVYTILYLFCLQSGLWLAGQSVTVFSITRSSGSLVYIMAVLLSVFVYAYYTKLNSLIYICVCISDRSTPCSVVAVEQENLLQKVHKAKRQ